VAGSCSNRHEKSLLHRAVSFFSERRTNMPPVTDALVDLTNRFIRLLQDVIQDDGTLIYQAGFADESLNPVVDLFGLGPLKWSASSNLGVPPSAVLEFIPPSFPRPGGVRLKLARPVDPMTGSVVAGSLGTAMVVERFPDFLNAFVLKAAFELPEGPHGARDQWAVALVTREGGLTDDPTNGRVVATLQSLFRTIPVARLNSPFSNFVIIDPGFLPPETFAELFTSTWTGKSPPAFTLEVRVDRSTDRVEAWLTTSTYTGYRLFSNSFALFINKNATGTEPVLNTIGVAGAGLGITEMGGNGPVAVILRDFRVFGRFGPSRPWSLLRDGAATAVLTPFRVISNILARRPPRNAPPDND
jgi:hypothetical protein